jgi:hypothetical protein
MAQTERVDPPQIRPSAWTYIFWFVQLLIALALVGMAALSINNVFGSGIEVDQLASEAACRGQAAGCEAMPMKWERSPFAHSMQVSTTGGSKVVRCAREHIFLGAWGCTSTDMRTSGGPLILAEPRIAKTVWIALPAATPAKPPKASPSAAPSLSAAPSASAAPSDSATP